MGQPLIVVLRFRGALGSAGEPGEGVGAPLDQRTPTQPQQ